MSPIPTTAVVAIAVVAAAAGVVAGVAVRRAVVRVPGARAPRRPAVEVATAAAFAVVAVAVASAAGRTPSAWSSSPVAVLLVAVAFLWLAAASIALTVVDVETRRLPDRLVLPGYVTGGALLGAAAIVSGDGASAVRAVLGLMLLGGFYLALRLVSPRGMGGGDVKLSGVLGLHLGWAGWAPLGVGAVAAFLLGGLASVVVVLSRRGGRQATIAFGPWMIAGAWIGLAWGDALVALYTGSLLRG